MGSKLFVIYLVALDSHFKYFTISCVQVCKIVSKETILHCFQFMGHWAAEALLKFASLAKFRGDNGKCQRD